ncbi:hypothetical protein DFQ28_010080 [Apophysomyces sp. BC1034]|nr:hypothetical protein DFQ28_010080 [Apophysomyces sp. BC1034]
MHDLHPTSQTALHSIPLKEDVPYNLFQSLDTIFDQDMATTALDEENSSSSMFAKRPSLSKEERRAEHNALERARRVSLNGKFRQLAEALPNLQNHRRPSKGQIVEKALDWVKQSVSKEDRYQYQIIQLQRENKRLLVQLNFGQDTDATPSPPESLPVQPAWQPPIPCPPWSASSTSSFDMQNGDLEEEDDDKVVYEAFYPARTCHRASVGSLGSLGPSYASTFCQQDSHLSVDSSPTLAPSDQWPPSEIHPFEPARPTPLFVNLP